LTGLWETMMMILLLDLTQDESIGWHPWMADKRMDVMDVVWCSV